MPRIACARNSGLYIGRDLSREDEREVIGWLDSDLGKRITRIEEDASKVDAAAEREKAPRHPRLAVSAERAQRFARCEGDPHGRSCRQSS